MKTTRKKVNRTRSQLNLYVSSEIKDTANQIAEIQGFRSISALFESLVVKQKAELLRQRIAQMPSSDAAIKMKKLLDEVAEVADQALAYATSDNEGPKPRLSASRQPESPAPAQALPAAQKRKRGSSAG